jgi:mannose-6-phosphate isomerase
MVWDFDSLVGL